MPRLNFGEVEDGKRWTRQSKRGDRFLSISIKHKRCSKMALTYQTRCAILATFDVCPNLKNGTY